MLEWFYNFTLSSNATLLVFICLTFPTKFKYRSDGQLRGRENHMGRLVLTSLSAMWVFFCSLAVLSGVMKGVKSKVNGVETLTYIEPSQEWLPFLVLLVSLYIYITYKLTKEHHAYIRRKSLLYVVKKYPSPKITLEKLHKFCKKVDTVLFPMLSFSEYLKELRKDEDEDKAGKAFGRMVEDMEQFQLLDRKRAMNRDCLENGMFYRNQGVL